MKNSTQNNSGITICDSIVMSVKHKRPNLRKLEAALLAVAGFTAVIMSFLGMFDLKYDEVLFLNAAIGFSVFYLTLSVIEGKALWILTGSVFVFAGAAYKMIHQITVGFKFVYNVIYKASFDTNIDYYKHIAHKDEEHCVTILMIFAVWLLAMVIYFFTICHPNPILPLLVTFPIIETGLYNGIEIPIFWGMLVIAYWLAMLGMSTIDIGEYSGGTGGFVRNEDLFFPKRQMKLKVTEKCGIFIVVSVLLVSLVTSVCLNVSGYKRSDKINDKRREISNAFSEFSINNLSESLNKISKALGFDIDFKDDRLGSKGSISFNNVTELTVDVSSKPNGALYLKDSVYSDYKDSRWKAADSSIYDAEIFADFDSLMMYPQEIPAVIAEKLDPDAVWLNISIKPVKDSAKELSPYMVYDYESYTHINDTLVHNENGDVNNIFTYRTVDFNKLKAAEAYAGPTKKIISISDDTISSSMRRKITEYANKKDILVNGKFVSITDNFPYLEYFNYAYNDGKLLRADMLINDYKDLVYSSFLNVPDNSSMKEIRTEYADILSMKRDTLSEKIQLLSEIRDRLSEETEYTLSPGKTPSNRDFANYFLLENKKGYCVHYATAGVLLARMAGIPARYATGYVIVESDFNSKTSNGDDSYTIDVQDNRSHAWAEIFLDGLGWVPFEFTSGYSDSSINRKEPVSTTTAAPVTTTTSSSTTTALSQTTSSSTSAADATSTTQDEATTSAATTAAAGSSGSSGLTIPEWFIRLVIILVVIALIVLAIYMRMRLITEKRRDRLYNGSSSKRIAYIYGYTEKLLAYTGVTRGDMQYMDFAAFADSKLASAMPEDRSFTSLMTIALRCGFGKTAPTDEELVSCLKTTEALASYIYSNASPLNKLKLKFMICLI